MDANQLKELTEYFDSRYVQKDACSDRHEKTDAKINTLLVDNAKINTKLALIIWVGGTAAGASIASLIASLYGAIFK